MNFNLDSYVEIGNTHHICEDYILHGEIGKIPFIVLSDGCSSSAHTDIGSRLIAVSFKRALTDFINTSGAANMSDDEIFEFIKSKVLYRLEYNLESLALKSSVADATMLYAFVFQGKLYTQMYGDGHILLKHVNGDYTQVERSYSENNPYYLSYQLDYMRNKAYSPSTALIETITNFPGNFDRVSINVPYNECYSAVFDAADIQLISIFSDGIESYQYLPNADKASSNYRGAGISEPIYWVCEMSEYKNTNGEFVKRRMKRVSSENTKAGIGHYDDVSVASIWINHE